MTSFGETLRQTRVAKKLSLRALASRVGINFTYLSKIENGELDAPAEDKIRLLAQELSLDPDELFTLAQKMPGDLSALTLRPLVPQILRTTKDFSQEDLEEMLRWARQKNGTLPE